MEEFVEVRNAMSSEEIDVLRKLQKHLFHDTTPGKQWKDYVFYPGCSPEAAQYAYDHWTPREGDVLLVGFFRSGVIWMNYVLKYMFYEGNELEMWDASPLAFVLLETDTSEKFPLIDKLPYKRRFITTNLPSELINVEKMKKAGVKIVYLVRNPKDLMVNFYKCCETSSTAKKEPINSIVNFGWDNYFERIIEGDAPINTKQGQWYLDHIISWYPHVSGKSNTYLIHYEDLKKDLKTQVKLLSEFLDLPMSDEKANRISTLTMLHNITKSLIKSNSVKGVSSISAMPKDYVGEWKTYFTVLQSERMDAIVKEKLKDIPISFIYEM